MSKLNKREIGTYTLFYKQPVHKQLALEWQIAKQLLELNALSLSNNENYRLTKSGVFPFYSTKHKIVVEPTIHQNPAISKALLGEIQITDHKYQF